MRKFHLIARSLLVVVPTLFMGVVGLGVSGSVGLALLAAGTLGGGVGFAWCLMAGRNEVYGSGGAADASSLSTSDHSRPTSLVTDLALRKMATVQFDPPPGIAPWEGMVLLRERYEKNAVLEAYFSGLAGDGIIEIRQDGETATCVPGPEIDAAGAEDRARVDALFEIGNPLVFGTRDPRVSRLIDSLHRELQAQLRNRVYWRHGTPRATGRLRGIGLALVAAVRVMMVAWSLLLIGVLLSFVGVDFSGVGRFLGSAPVLSLLTFGLTLWIGRRAFGVLWPARSAIGSALTLHTESFRRFLHESESEQVREALDRGVLREYAGWAVALDETDAWSDSISTLNIPMIDFSFMVRDVWSFYRNPESYRAIFRRRHLREKADVPSLIDSLADGAGVRPGGGLSLGEGLDLTERLGLGEGLGDGEDFVREEVLRDASGREIGRRTIRFITRRSPRN